MKIITISREFGSGGRELGKRLSEKLGFRYYDREIITAIAKGCNMNENYVENFLDGGKQSAGFAISFGRTFSYIAPHWQEVTKIFVTEQKIIKELAKGGDCVIVGRSADAILKDLNPFNIFVYADMPSKIERCRQRETNSETLPDKAITKKIKAVDAGRRQHHDILSNFRWGEKEGYHLCINTSGRNIKTLIPAVADYAEEWFN